MNGNANKHLTIPQALQKRVESSGSKTALIYYGAKFSYGDLGQQARLFAQVFMDLGVRPGDRVALMMSNVPQFVFAYYGAVLAGAIVTPINLLSLPRSYRARGQDSVLPDEIRTQIFDAKPHVIVAFDFYLPLLKEFLEEYKEYKPILVLTRAQEHIPQPLKLLASVKLWREGRRVKIERGPRLHHLERLICLQKGEVQPFHSFPGLQAEEGDIVQLQYTGGTTGSPKGVMLSHGNLLSNVRQMSDYYAEFLVPEKEVVLAVLPFFHVYGLTVVMQTGLLGQGGTLVLVADPYDLARWFSWIKKYQITIIAGIPRIYERALQLRKLSKDGLSSVKLFLSGAGGLSKRIRQSFEEFAQKRILEGYGLTEASPAVSSCSPRHFKEGSVGRPLPNTKIRIVNPETGLDLPAMQEGEIVVQGPQVMQGYWQKPAETAQVLRSGWLYTGDIGYLDEQGFLYITDRLKDMVKIKGENVFPAKVEKFLASHPSVKDVAAVGILDEKRGERLVACVVPDGPPDNPEQLRQDLLTYLAQYLASFEIPSEIIFIESLDAYKNQLGKVLKRQLREALKYRRLTSGIGA